MAVRKKEDLGGIMPKGAEHLLLQKSEISLWLDSYDDIFSDFDSRPYTNRALSQDFLEEAKRASRDKDIGRIELALLIPKKGRKRKHENLIRKRLLNHFGKHREMVRLEKAKMVKEGSVFAIVGVIVMFTAVMLVYFNHENFLSNSMLVLLEPAGWFFFWEGLREILLESRVKNQDIEFYNKMSKCYIRFLSY